ncbi:Concanavalin A-like lectin/glucanases superfamily protein [Saccharopolyspora kobensis]|uniref:Concanavalin A-like lectin/glucanases superfamily protein n=1 Tax=Saccharopolyspora kobensis TaxID=146035 RepID=A0A1H5XWY9_9PSEU|nr:LamG domain-containing protein [Saccharopolyspora kobensis]SEG16188.1 Concanavalin A-like lectin/glucanases superfamily protein [Saccharopolyspora kobensis]SFF10621.1 Concanavalin A-like lectin/glucanases superfamily protein [Saccharopolyspora kobensis]
MVSRVGGFAAGSPLRVALVAAVFAASFSVPMGSAAPVNGAPSDVAASEAARAQRARVVVESRTTPTKDVRLLTGQDSTLVHNWRLDETSGTTAADSVGGVPGTVQGAAAFAPGRVGNAIALDGVDDHVSTSTVNLRTSESFTVSAWVYLSSKHDGQFTAVSVDGANTSKFRLGHFLDRFETPFGSWVFEMPETDTESAPVTKAALSVLGAELNTWTHLVGVYDAVTGRVWLYVNGERVGDGNLQNPWSAAGGTQIGRGKEAGAPAEFWPGGVDDVRIYTERLSTDRIKTLYASYGAG